MSTDRTDDGPHAVEPTPALYGLVARHIADRWPAWAQAHPQLVDVVDTATLLESCTDAIARPAAAEIVEKKFDRLT